MINITKLISSLHNQYINPKTELENWANGVQFMVSVILSAQATDKGVNRVTPSLFERYKTAKDFAEADIEDLSEAVSSINFYKTKSKRIIDACKYIVQYFDGQLPDDINKLIKIPGIGRKSANVILHEVFDKSQGIVVDTHMIRVSNRLGLTSQNDPEKIENELMSILPKDEWKFFSRSVVLLGRYICKAKKPNCEECPLKNNCPSAFKY